MKPLPAVRSTRQVWWGMGVFALAFLLGVPFAADLTLNSLFMLTGLALGTSSPGPASASRAA